MRLSALCWHLPIFPGDRLRALPVADEASKKVCAAVEIDSNYVATVDFGHRKRALMGCTILSVGRVACWKRPLCTKKKST